MRDQGTCSEVKVLHVDLKTKIEHILSDILSDKHGCKVTVKFEKKAMSAA